jgi:uncharacterized membrane protein YkoI
MDASRATLPLVLLAGLGHAQDRARMVDLAEYPLPEAIERGLKEAGGGFPFHAELENDKGVVVYSIDVAQDARTCNVVLDVKEGRVVAKEVEDEDHSEAVKACRITLKEAIEAALRETPGTAVEARLVTVNRQPRILVKVLAGGREVLASIDGVTGAGRAPRQIPKEKAFTDTFDVEPGEWSPTGSNPFFVLEPGHVLVLEDKETRLTITVLDETKVIAGVETRVVEEREEEGGKLAEVSRNYFAISKRTNSVYYFGEDVDIHEDGKVTHEGAWLTGEKGARYGLMMAGTPLLGARYYQEIAPDVAMDRAEIVGLDETVETPAGKFERCLRTEESTPLEGGHESKWYARGIGLVRDGDLRLTKHGRAK